MPRKQHKYHYIYKTTCSVTNKFYIGMHSTSDLEDGYIGSGQRLWKSINKHGKENHAKEILEFLPDRRSLKVREYEIVNEDLLKDLNCLNIARGGQGGFVSHNQASKGGKAMVAKLKLDPNYSKKLSERATISNSKRWETLENKENILKALNWTGRKHRDETKQLMSEKAKSRKPEQNSQYRTVWIHNIELKLNKKIRNEEFHLYPNWVKGRKMKF